MLPNGPTMRSGLQHEIMAFLQLFHTEIWCFAGMSAGFLLRIARSVFLRFLAASRMLAVSGASIWNGKSERPFTGRHFVDLPGSSQPSSAVYHRDPGATLSSALGRISSENITIGV